MVSCFYEIPNSLIPVAGSYVYIFDIIPRRQILLSVHRSLEIIFRALYGSHSVNYPSHSKLSSSESFLRVSKKFFCSDNVFLMLFSKRLLWKKLYCSLFLGVINLVITAINLRAFPLFPDLLDFCLRNACIYFELLYPQQYIFHQAHTL